MAYVIKTRIDDIDADRFVFPEAKTMYGGRRIAAGDTIFLFASENSGGSGLIGRGVVTHAEPVPPIAGLERQTPRVSIAVRREAKAHHPLGRAELKPFRAQDDGRPESELDFKLYRQATDKIVGISAETERFLDALCA